MSSPVTVRLEDETRNRLDQLAKTSRRSRSAIAAQAIREFVELSDWQVSETRKALTEAKRGEFATESEVKRFFDGWRRRAS